MKTFQFERQQQACRRQTEIRGRKALQLRPRTARPGPPGITGQHLEVGVPLTQQIHSWETGSNTPTSRRPSRVPTGRKLQSLGPLGRGPATPRPTPSPQSQGCRQTSRLIQDTARTRRRRSLTGAPRTRRLEVGFTGISVAALRQKEYPCPVLCSLPHTFPESLHIARNLLTKINCGADPGPSGAPGRQLPKWGSHR